MKAVHRSIWDTLPEPTKEALFAGGTQEVCAKGAEIFGELDDVDCLFFLLDGYVSLYRSSFHGETRVIFICAAGEILNEVVLENAKTSIAAKALSEVTLLRVPLKELFRLVREDESLATALFQALAQKTRRLYHKVGNANGTYALKDRLAATVWKLARDYGVPAENGQRVDFDISVYLLSDMMGAKRESVSRALSELKRSGLITLENGTLTVLDMQRLRSMVSDR